MVAGEPNRPGQTTGVHEHGALARADVAVADGGPQPGERPAGVDGVEHESLGAGRQHQRLADLVGQGAVAGADLVGAQPYAAGSPPSSPTSRSIARERVGGGAGVDAEHPLGAEGGDQPGRRAGRADRDHDVAHVGHLVEQLVARLDVRLGAEGARPAVRHPVGRARQLGDPGGRDLLEVLVG